MILLDTNVVIHVLKKRMPVVRRYAEHVGDMAIPAMVQGELLFGVAKSNDPARNRELLKTLTDSLPVMHTNDAIMQTFATQKAALSARGEFADGGVGTPRGELERQGRHFVRFDGLLMEDWSA